MFYDTDLNYWPRWSESQPRMRLLQSTVIMSTNADPGWSISKHKMQRLQTNKGYHLAWQNTPCCVPCDKVSHSVTITNLVHMPTCLHLTWLSVLDGTCTSTQLNVVSLQISGTETVVEVLHIHCDLGLEHSNQIFSQDTSTFDDIPSYLIWF